MAGHSEIEQVAFGISTDSDRLESSHVAVTSYELFSQSGQPVSGGVYDLRMGTTDHSYLCLTCAHGKKLCPGHRGHLVLRAGVMLSIGIAEIRRWLHVVCNTCGELMVDHDKYARIPAAKRLAEAATAVTEGKRCSRGHIHPRIEQDSEDHFTFWATPPGGPKTSAKPGKPGGSKPHAGVKLYADVIRTIFERVTDTAVQAMGRTPNVHPRNLIIRVLSVPPNTIRPGVKSYGGTGSSYHDTTNLLQHIVKRNSQLPERMPAVVDDELDRSLQNLQQVHYDLIYGSSVTSSTQGNRGRRGLVTGSRAVHSILRNLPRKEGRSRANLLGKRVVFIARSTISGNARLRVDEVGIPYEYARILQVSEIVQEYNRDWLQPFFLNARRQYPGCTYIIKRSTGEMHDVANLRDMQLEDGDEILRDVITGDFAYIGRQPTLERSSIGMHRVVVIEDPSVRTILINVLSCAWYGADFNTSESNRWLL
jgi:DNA-directed RNA polymerase beta' subunit